MLTIKAPLEYLSEPGIIAHAGSYIAKYGKRAVVVGSKTSFQVAGQPLLDSLTEHGITYTTHLFEGFPSESAFSPIQTAVRSFQADTIIGLGGGRVLDTVKVVGDREALSVVAIPTIAATCAAWASVTIVYDEEGTMIDVAPNTNSPKLILADTQIIAAAPERYLKAGIVDTLAKFYETEPNLAVDGELLTLNQTVNTAQLAYRELTQYLDETLADLRSGTVTRRVTNAIDAVIYLAGLVGSITSNFYGGFAHSFYNVVTSVPGTRDRLHGERVAFGLLIQFVLEGKSKAEIARELRIFRKLDQPLTLEAIGFPEKDEATLERVASELLAYLPSVKFLSGLDAAAIKAAIHRADEIGKTDLREA
ncbi:MAG: gldA [Oscillospiraceae bacterium]|nr:gldA [Oscillospiraceae bacterium]